MAAAERIICRVDELKDSGPGVRFVIPLVESGRDLPCIAVSHAGAVYAYVNSCPHRGTELDWQEGQVFDETGLYLMCATHGALFEPDSGLCVGGPCCGARLRSLAVKVVGNDVMLSSDSDDTDNEKRES
jgi:nitrite reductase/ring-hydroxylating ferredoxin subunit